MAVSADLVTLARSAAVSLQLEAREEPKREVIELKCLGLRAKPW